MCIIKHLIIPALNGFYTCYVSFWRNSPTWARAASCSRLLDHIQWHSTLGRTPQDEGSARRRDISDKTQHSQTDIHAPSGIWTRNPSKRSAVDPRLWPLGRWDRHYVFYLLMFKTGSCRVKLRWKETWHNEAKCKTVVKKNVFQFRRLVRYVFFS
jgi:hypothetical protein